MRVIKTQFPGRYRKNGTLRYIPLPAEVVERMDLKENDPLDVTVTIPIRDGDEKNE